VNAEGALLAAVRPRPSVMAAAVALNRARRTLAALRTDQTWTTLPDLCRGPHGWAYVLAAAGSYYDWGDTAYHYVRAHPGAERAVAALLARHGRTVPERPTRPPDPGWVRVRSRHR
jgi:hypothetical protein